MASVLIPWEPGCSHRTAALGWVRERYREIDLEPELVEIENFTKARAANRAGEVGGDIIVLADADCWAGGIPEAIRAVENGAGWAMPHRRVHRLTEEATAEVLAGESPKGKPTVEDPYVGAKGGGIVVVRRSVLRAVPWDERYEGWGRQDLSWRAAMTTFHGDPVRGKADLWHLYHPPMPRRERAVSLSEASEALYARYKDARGDMAAIHALLKEARCSRSSVPPARRNAGKRVAARA